MQLFVRITELRSISTSEHGNTSVQVQAQKREKVGPATGHEWEQANAEQERVKVQQYINERVSIYNGKIGM